MWGEDCVCAAFTDDCWWCVRDKDGVCAAVTDDTAGGVCGMKMVCVG